MEHIICINMLQRTHLCSYHKDQLLRKFYANNVLHAISRLVSPSIGALIHEEFTKQVEEVGTIGWGASDPSFVSLSYIEGNRC
jgi:hypothetical protein